MAEYIFCNFTPLPLSGGLPHNVAKAKISRTVGGRNGEVGKVHASYVGPEDWDDVYIKLCNKDGFGLDSYWIEAFTEDADEEYADGHRVTVHISCNRECSSVACISLARRVYEEYKERCLRSGPRASEDSGTLTLRSGGKWGSFEMDGRDSTVKYHAKWDKFFEYQLPIAIAVAATVFTLFKA